MQCLFQRRKPDKFSLFQRVSYAVSKEINWSAVSIKHCKTNLTQISSSRWLAGLQLHIATAQFVQYVNWIKKKQQHDKFLPEIAARIIHNLKCKTSLGVSLIQRTNTALPLLYCMQEFNPCLRHTGRTQGEEEGSDDRLGLHNTSPRSTQMQKARAWGIGLIYGQAHLRGASNSCSALTACICILLRVIREQLWIR